MSFIDPKGSSGSFCKGFTRVLKYIVLEKLVFLRALGFLITCKVYYNRHNCIIDPY